MNKMWLLLLLILSGCKSNITDYRDVDFIDKNTSSIYSIEHSELCARKKDSIFCVNSESIGDIKPTKKYALNILKTMNNNFTYTNNEKWIYNNTVYEHLNGDCEDIVSTMIQHMIDDGIDKKYLFIAFRYLENNTSHVFLAIDTIDGGMLHLDYGNSGYPIEPNINFHMRMDDVGIYKWIKGNIK